MGMINTEAWVLYRGHYLDGSNEPVPYELRRETFSFTEPGDCEVLAEPIYGCWEANMTHALERSPVDVCEERGEEKVVIGNAGVVRILKPGKEVKSVKEGDLCILFCNGVWDESGYPLKILAYDAPNSIGLLAKRTKLHERQVIRIPEYSRHSPQQWAAFSLRYITAWANWEVAYGCWHVLAGEEGGADPGPSVWGWGGGVSLAELLLAKHFGCDVAMLSSGEQRLETIKNFGIKPIDRRQFPHLHFDARKYKTDAQYKEQYLKSEDDFLGVVRENTRGAGVSIFADYIGEPVVRATLKSLARRGVITTAGWKGGMKISTVRAIECMNWHIHVHTHYARYSQGLAAVRFAEEKGWLPPIDSRVYDWDQIPLLAQDYSAGKVNTYFPIYQINPL